MGKRTRTNEEEERSSTSGNSRQGESIQGNKRGGSKLRYKTTASSKRSKSTLTLPAPLSLEGSLSEEVLLRCLSFLTAHDLVTVSRVSSAWYRLSQDPQLWRFLYLRTYASASTRRQALSGAPIARSRPWKDLYKISTNWRNGTAKSTTVLTNTVRKAVLAPLPTDMALPGEPEAPRLPLPPTTGQGETHETLLLQVYQQYFISATQTPSLLPSDPPSITISQTLPSGPTQHLASISSSRLSDFYSSRPDFRPPLSITELKLDEGSTSTSQSTSILLSVFYSTGQFSIFRLYFPTPSTPFNSLELYTSLSLSSSTYTQSSTSPFDSVSLAKLHYPLLVTCSTSFTLRFYQLSTLEDGQLGVRETDTPLQSRERWAPVCLGLEKTKSQGTHHQDKEKSRTFKVSLAYSLPVFPGNWTVGLQEFTLILPPCAASSSVSISVLSALSPPPPSALPTRHYSHHPFSPSALPSLSPVTSISYSSPYIVTSLCDNTIRVYTLHRPTPEKLQIRLQETLFGHTARVGSLSIVPVLSRRGECKVVSAGDDGVTKVWQLGKPNNKRKKVEEMVEIVTDREEEEEEEGGTEFQKMKLRRLKGLTVRREEERGRPEKVRKVLVEEDKIVLIGGVEEGERGEERVRVLRFD
ncbi:hypothetical protein JCM5353_007795 [Sporobolomyces roseus]